MRRDLDDHSRNNQTDYSVYNLSISGNTTRDILERVENEARCRRQTDKETQIYLVIGGGNDSQIKLDIGESLITLEEYKSNVREIISIAERLADKVVLFTGTPCDESESYPMNWKTTHGYKNSRTKQYEKNLVEISADTGYYLVNFSNQINTEYWDDMLYDGVHPNTKGHKLMYKIAREELSNQDYIPL